MKETKIWKLGRTVVDEIGQIIEKVRPKTPNNEEGEDEGNKLVSNPLESGSGVAVSVTGPESRKTPVRGQTTGEIQSYLKDLKS